MDRREFDRFADEYRAMHRQNIRASGFDPEHFALYKARDLADCLTGRAANRSSPRILDFGCGVGNGLAPLAKTVSGACLTGVDVSLRSLGIAHERLGDATSLVAFDGHTLPFADGTFDAALAACVFHHIDGREHVPLLRELWRVLRTGGVLMVYEHNPFNPLTVRAVRTCPFDEHAVLIRPGHMRARVRGAGFAGVRVRHRVFFPKWLSPLMALEDHLGAVPLGAQYYVIGQRADE